MDSWISELTVVDGGPPVIAWEARIHMEHLQPSAFLVNASPSAPVSSPVQGTVWTPRCAEGCKSIMEGT